MIEIALIFAFLALLMWGIEDFLAQKSARKIGDMESLAIIMIVGAVILTPFVIKDLPMLFSKQILLILAIVLIIHFLEGVFYFEALKRGKLSITSIIFEFELPITVILALLFFGESLSLPQFLLIGGVFAGIMLIATKSFSHLKIKLEKGIIFAIIAAVLIALVDFSSAFSVRAASPVLTVWFVWVTNSILCLVYLGFKNKNLKFCRDCWNMKWLVFVMGIVATLAWLFYFFAIKKELAMITAITEAYPVITITLGLLINKERINWHQYLGMALALSAAIALALVWN